MHLVGFEPTRDLIPTRPYYRDYSHGNLARLPNFAIGADFAFKLIYIFVKTFKEYVEAIEQSPEFERWFKGSKVVDEKGMPMVVYHGTRHSFSAFDRDKIASSTDNGYFGKGFYFVTDPEYAGVYAGDQGFGRYGQGGNLMPLYLSIKNPYIIKWSGGNRETEDPASFTEKLKSAGYDGVQIEKNPRYGKWYEYVAFDPAQIKSATGNRGTFDPNNSDIKEQHGSSRERSYKGN